jgi:OmpA-OmpF porin, OOP family
LLARYIALITGILGLVYTWSHCVHTARPSAATPQAPARATPAPLPAPQPAPPTIVQQAPVGVALVLAADGSLKLEGSVRDVREKTRLLSAAQKVFGAERVQDALKLDDTLAQLSRLTLTGRVEDEAARSRLTLDAAKAVGVGVAIDDRLEVAAPAQAPPSALPSAGAAPVSPEAAAQQGKLRALLEGRAIEFERGSAQLTSQGKALLDEIGAVIQSERATRIEIQGHTDARGQAEANVKLSEDRALATLEYLAGKGVAPERLSAHGYGSRSPVADNATAEGRARNRRIEFLVKEGN